MDVVLHQVPSGNGALDVRKAVPRVVAPHTGPDFPFPPFRIRRAVVDTAYDAHNFAPYEDGTFEAGIAIDVSVVCAKENEDIFVKPEGGKIKKKWGKEKGMVWSCRRNRHIEKGLAANSSMWPSSATSPWLRMSLLIIRSSSEVRRLR